MSLLPISQSEIATFARLCDPDHVDLSALQEHASRPGGVEAIVNQHLRQHPSARPSDPRWTPISDQQRHQPHPQRHSQPHGGAGAGAGAGVGVSGVRAAYSEYNKHYAPSSAAPPTEVDAEIQRGAAEAELREKHALLERIRGFKREFDRRNIPYKIESFTDRSSIGSLRWEVDLRAAELKKKKDGEGLFDVLGIGMGFLEAANRFCGNVINLDNFVTHTLSKERATYVPILEDLSLEYNLPEMFTPTRLLLVKLLSSIARHHKSGGSLDGGAAADHHQPDYASGGDSNGANGSSAGGLDDGRSAVAPGAARRRRPRVSPLGGAADDAMPTGLHASYGVGSGDWAGDTASDYVNYGAHPRESQRDAERNSDGKTALAEAAMLLAS